MITKNTMSQWVRIEWSNKLFLGVLLDVQTLIASLDDKSEDHSNRTVKILFFTAGQWLP